MVDQCAHDDLRRLLMDYGVEPDQADWLVPVIAGWAKGQDEDWPWDDGTPAPEPTDWSTHPSITDPGWLARAQEHAIWAQGFLRRMFRDPGNPAAFQAVTHRELGHPVDEDTRALAARWVQDPPLPERWQPSVRIPAGTIISRTGYTVDTGMTWWDMPVVHNPHLRPGEFYIMQRPTPPRPFFHITWRTP